MQNRILLAAAWMILLAAQCAVAADFSNSDWRSWRGPLGNGSVDNAGKNYPVTFGADKYLWRTELPGKGCSTPILLDGKIFLTAPADGRDALLCYDSNGKEQWRTTFGQENKGKHRNGSGCNASPVSDGTAVFAFFKSGTLAAVEPAGKVRWKTNLVERFGKDTLFWTTGLLPC